MKLSFGYLVVVTSWGLFVFQLPGLAENLYQWQDILNVLHSKLVSMASYLAERLPSVPDRWQNMTHWQATVERFRFWPNLVVIVLSLLAVGLMSFSVVLVEVVAIKSDSEISHALMVLLYTYLVYGLVGPKLILHSAFPTINPTVIFEPFLSTVHRAPNPTEAYYLMQIYSLLGIVGAAILVTMMVLAWRQYKQRA